MLLFEVGYEALERWRENGTFAVVVLREQGQRDGASKFLLLKKLLKP